MIEACEHIIDLVVDPSFTGMTERSIPAADRVPGKEGVSNMIAFDFGVCINDKNELEPQLIEMQGFPTLYGFQVYYPELIPKYFNVPSNYSQYLGGLDHASYLDRLSKVILGKHQAENVILLEIKPHEQKTRIDFYCTKDYIGIQPVCITELIQEGTKLFYLRDGIKTEVRRIYNRVIFDDLHSQKKQLGTISCPCISCKYCIDDCFTD